MIKFNLPDQSLCLSNLTTPSDVQFTGSIRDKAQAELVLNWVRENRQNILSLSHSSCHMPDQIHDFFIKALYQEQKQSGRSFMNGSVQSLPEDIQAHIADLSTNDVTIAVDSNNIQPTLDALRLLAGSAAVRLTLTGELPEDHRQVKSLVQYLITMPCLVYVTASWSNTYWSGLVPAADAYLVKNGKRPIFSKPHYEDIRGAEKVELFQKISEHEGNPLRVPYLLNASTLRFDRWPELSSEEEQLLIHAAAAGGNLKRIITRKGTVIDLTNPEQRWGMPGVSQEQTRLHAYALQVLAGNIQ